MEAVLYICHGSRMKKACEQAFAFVETCMDKVSIPIQEVSFLELAEPSIEQGFRQCVERGATKIYAVPVLLLTAVHAKEDIPEILSTLSMHYPDVEIVYGRPFGVHESITEILYERIMGTNVSIDGDCLVLLVGRGSSDPDVKRDLEGLAGLLEKRYGLKHVDVCFLTAADPIFEDVLEEVRYSNYSKVFIVPYLLFTGLLMKRIEKAVCDVNKLSNQQFILTHYLEYHPHLKDVLVERVEELSHLPLEERNF
ncbi:sirohydrochlorin chelatase [Priestia abyssalis]|uniref:sirohydrochlorin chelatase n=1 Tax=Priestia abyssalis TaxID=1221450 RepID=UPI00099574D9|nr:sirohydrochlorin chelatase [Priestia abyssalis]